MLDDRREIFETAVCRLGRRVPAPAEDLTKGAAIVALPSSSTALYARGQVGTVRKRTILIIRRAYYSRQLSNRMRATGVFPHMGAKTQGPTLANQKDPPTA